MTGLVVGSEECKVRAEGAEAIAEALKTNTMLIHLNLTDNQLHLSGGKALNEALKINQHLQYLNVESTKCLMINSSLKVVLFGCKKQIPHLLLFVLSSTTSPH
mgnify:CR=1 FL=1